MPTPELWSFRHADARWVQLALHPRQLHRTEGVKARASSHVLTRFASAAAVKRAASEQRHALHRDGYRRVARLGRFVPVPVEAWRETEPRARTRKPAIAGTPAGALEARVAALDAVEGLVITYRRGKPARASALAAAEKQLGRPLPPSLRAFLAKHDGLRVEWKLASHGWGVAFEIFSLREMLKERRFRGDSVELDGGLLLPIAPTFDQPVLGALLRAGREAKIVELMDPPDGEMRPLAPSFAAFVDKAVRNHFVVTGRSAVSDRQLPAIRKVLRVK
jgi:hypothetical protein